MGIIAPPGVPASTLRQDYYLPSVIPTTQIACWGNSDGIQPRIWKFRDRILAGAAAVHNGDFVNTNATWLGSLAYGASWAVRDSQFLFMSDRGTMALTAASRSSDNDGKGAPIAVSGFIINDKANVTSWCHYADVQHESGAFTSWGCEYAVKNKSTDVKSNPFTANGPYGACGNWFPAGGDGGYGGTAANPNNFAIGIKGFGSTWNTGLLFLNGSLTLDSNSLGDAIHMAPGHRVMWSTATVGGQASLYLDPAVAASATTTAIKFGNGLTQVQAGGKAIVNISGTASAANYWNLVAGNAGSQPTLTVDGSDTNIYASISGKGSQGVLINSGDGVRRFRCNSTGIGFNGTTEIAKPTLAAALPTDGTATAAQLATAYNSLRTALINYGLCQ